MEKQLSFKLLNGHSTVMTDGVLLINGYHLRHIFLASKRPFSKSTLLQSSVCLVLKTKLFRIA